MADVLYTDPRGAYTGLGVECWDVARDATRYDGCGPVVAHPPCGPWSRLAHLCGAALLAQKHLGPIAVAQVRRFGGVLEHPADSALWTACAMPPPGHLPAAWGGWSVRVDQWFWGHRAVKPTWLYIVGRPGIPAMPPRPSGARPASGGRAARARDPKLRPMLERMSSNERHLTPPAFARWLLELADGCCARPALEVA